MLNKILWFVVGYCYLVLLPAWLFFKGAHEDEDEDKF